ncbi:MAG: HAD family hydrolase [Ruminococcaceae bacterium]|nr:HAD family hydrolase [Oscillospiraceae bacterium]
MPTTILFDLDGTLTDPGLGITNSILYALGKMGFPKPPRENLYPFIGPPLTESFQKYCGMTAAQAEEALRLYREYFSVTGLFENSVYDGIPEMLASLRNAELRLCLATSKPEIYARRIVERFDLAPYLDFVGGATLSGERNAKADVIAYVLNETGTAADQTIMVGDRRHDVEGAAVHRIPAIGVLWGYGDETELRTAGAAQIASDPGELARLILAACR